MIKRLTRLIGIVGVMFFNPTVFAAETSAASPRGDILSSMLLFSAIFVMFYVMMIRPQNKRQKEHKGLLERLAVGDEIITTGGILGKINRVTESFFIVSICEGVDITIQKQAVASALPKGTIKSL